MKTPTYLCRYEPDTNDTLLVSCDAFPEVVTYGTDLADAQKHALGAIEEAIAARISENRTVPETLGSERDEEANVFVVKLPQVTAQKVILYGLLMKSGVTRAELARRLAWHREQVDRLFRIDHASKASQLDSAFLALGHDVEIVVTERKDPIEKNRVAA